MVPRPKDVGCVRILSENIIRRTELVWSDLVPVLFSAECVWCIIQLGLFFGLFLFMSRAVAG